MKIIELDVDKEIDYLIGHKNRRIDQNDNVIPEYLIPCYSRLTAIENLVTLNQPDEKKKRWY